VFIEAKDDGSGGDNWIIGATSRAKLQSNHHHQQTNIQFFTGRMPFLSPNQQCQSTEWKYHIPWTCLPKLTWRSSNFVSNHLIAPGYLGVGCHASHQPSDASTRSVSIFVTYKLGILTHLKIVRPEGDIRG